MLRTALVLFALSLAACGGRTDEQFKAEIAAKMKQQIFTDITALRRAAEALRDTVPTGHGWSATGDAPAIGTMKDEWKRARTAYERIEGAIAPIFPDTDAAIDERYDGYLEELGAAGDPNLFDGEGVRGMHGIERILFLDTTPQNVKVAEAAIPGYSAAAWPATAQQADDFKTKLCEQLVRDVAALETQWAGAGLDLAGAWQGLVDLMNEQREKVNNASAGFEESRYAQVTMADLRNNYAGTVAAWELFRGWALAKPGGETLRDDIDHGFAQLKASYDAVQGDAIPAPPATWSAETPSAADLATDFGRLYTDVRQATDPNRMGSLVDRMGEAAVLFGFRSGQ